MENDRPISVLPIVSKILERAVQIQLKEHMEENDLFSPYQFAFRHHHSTEAAVTYLTDRIRRNMDGGLLTGAVFLDFRKAFDTIDHQKLLEKLPSFGICDDKLYIRRFIIGTKLSLIVHCQNFSLFCPGSHRVRQLAPFYSYSTRMIFLAV